ncbi:MAG: hypothetical protein AAF299_14520 [Pseudomonadota bacterium]
MKTVLITYASDAFAPWQKICTVTGQRFGFDVCHALGPKDIEPEFALRHATTLQHDRGAGYWLWKPYFVQRMLADMTEGDILVYADAATHFVNPVTPMISALERHSLDLLILGEGFSEAQYTKRDAFVLMDADTKPFTQTPQRFASSFMLRKSGWAVDFMKRYLICAEDRRILTDEDNVCGLPDYPDFIAHRHDQSIFSLLSKQEGVPVVVKDMIVEGLPDRAEQIINHTRSRMAPIDIIRDLMAQGVLSPNDLPALTS